MGTQIRRTRQEWAAIIAAWETSGQSIPVFSASVPGLSERSLRARIDMVNKENPEKITRALRADVAELRAQLAACTCRSAASVTAPSETCLPIGG